MNTNYQKKLDCILEEIEKKIADLEKKKKDIIAEQKAQLEADKEIRRKEVDKAREEYIAIRDKFIADYGHYQYNTDFLSSLIFCKFSIGKE